MRRWFVLLCIGAAGVVGAGSAASAASAGKLCVGGPGCFGTVQAAVDAAGDGDTIKIGPGTFAGGITIDKSVTLLGSGAKATTIEGGGPVVTVGEFLAAEEPTVTISRLTITGGVSTSSPLSTEWVGVEDVIALGGGLEILPAEGYTTGGTVTLSESMVSGNRAAPSETVPFGPPCPGGPCPFALARGGGIDNWGTLSLKNATVGDNVAAGVASDADGGGISDWWPGTVTMVNSRVVGNQALAAVPNGRFAEGGGIFTDPGVQLNVRNSVVSGNTASLTSTLPFDVGGGDTLDMNANGGGIHVGDDSSVTIENTKLNDNTVSVVDAAGEPYGFDAALHPGSGPLILRNSTIADNQVIADVASTDDVGPSGSAIDLNGPATVSGVRITGNTTVVTSHAGAAAASGAMYSGSAGEPASISNSVIQSNTVSASSAGGPAIVVGGGLVNDGLLLLRNVLIADNSGAASGPSGFARGGGIWNGSLFSSPPIQLTLENTTVMRNAVSGSAGITLQGGGLFTDFPVTLVKSRIANNTPDQCFGC